MTQVISEDAVKDRRYFDMKVSQAATLADLSKEWGFFTVGLFYAASRLTDDPVSDFLAKQPQPSKPFILKFDKPIFKGLDTRFSKAWNHCLLAVDNRLMEALTRYVSQVCVVDVDRQDYWQAAVQDVPIADPLALQKTAILPSPCPTVDIVFFGMDGLHWTKGIKPAFNPPLDLPEVETLDPRPEVVRRANEILRGGGQSRRPVNESLVQAIEREQRESNARNTQQDGSGSPGEGQG